MGGFEDEEGGLERMPYEAAVALGRVGWHEAWRASLRRAEKAGHLDAVSEKTGGKKAGAVEKNADWHKKKAAKAAEAWNLLVPQWLDAPRGHKEGAEVAKALLDAAKAAGEHVAARRVGLLSEGEQGKKAAREAEEEAVQAYQRFEAAREALKEHRAVMRSSLADTATELLWACSWHAANTTSDAEEIAMIAAEDEEDAEPEYDDEDEDGNEGEDDEAEDDEDEDDEAKFGAEYPGSSDDAVQDHLGIVGCLKQLFWDPKYPWHGVRIHLREDAAAAEAAVEAVSKVPAFSGPFPQGLNSVRLVLREALCTPKDPLGELARAALAKAEACGLKVMLEVPAKPNAKGEEWVRKVAQEAAALKCVRGVALPEAGNELEKVGKMLAALRAGGLGPERCQAVLGAPEPEDEEGETMDGWSEEFRALHKSDPSAASQNALLQDGNVLLERPAAIPPKEEGGPEDQQGVLDAASHAADGAQDLDLVSCWSLEAPKGIKFKSKDGPSDDWYRELAQRILGSVHAVERGWFFEAWDASGCDGDVAQHELKSALEKGWLDFSAQDQVIAPTGAKHTHSFIYLHGYQCDGYSYMCEPEYFYKVKKKAKKKGSKSKTKGDSMEDDDEEDFEPHPGMKVILPSAPLRKITAARAEEMPSWYDYLTDLDGEGEDDFPKEELEEVTKRIHELLDREVAAVGAKNVFLGGASQGSGVALHCALTYPGGGLGGICCTMGHVLSMTEIKSEWVETKTPVHVYHGLADETMPWEKWVEPTYKRLGEAGVTVKVTLEGNVDHGDGDREMAWTRNFLTEVLRPASVKKVEAKKKPAAGGKKK